MILIIQEPATLEQIAQMLEEYSDRIKTAVDIERRILAGGGELHADCEEVLLDNGTPQANIWAAAYFPSERKVVCESMVNLRPNHGNRSMEIQDDALKARVTEIILELLSGATSL